MSCFATLNIIINAMRPSCQNDYCSHTVEGIQHEVNDIMNMNTIIKKECHLTEYLKINAPNITRTKRGAFNV